MRLIRAGRKSIGESSRDLDLKASAVRRWVRQAEFDEGGGNWGAETSSERREQKRLLRESRQLQVEREILSEEPLPFSPRTVDQTRLQ